MSDLIDKRYSNGDIAIRWQPHLCVYSKICCKGLPHVFDPRKRPWINQYAATSEEIIEQVRNCPSGALSIIEIPGD